MAGSEECQDINNLRQINGNFSPEGDATADGNGRKRRLDEISNVTDDDCGLTPTLKMPPPDIENNPSGESADELVSPFQPNERCFAVGDDGTGYIYLGTVKQVAQLAIGNDSKGPRWKYLVHYNGWNSRFDQWMMEEQVFPDNEHYRAVSEKSQIELREMKQSRKDNKLRVVEKGIKRKSERRQSNVARSQREESPKRIKGRPAKEQRSMTESFVLPMTLKIIMVNDQSYINRLGKTLAFTGYDRVSNDAIPARKVHELPSSIPVSRILKQFAKSIVQEKKKALEAKNNDDTEESTIVNYSAMQQNYKDFASHLSNLFDAMLPKFLLYRFEQEQYSILCRNKDIKQDAEGAALDSKISMSNIYSGEFLLRMIVRLPYILSAMEATPKMRIPSSSQRNGDTEYDIFAKWKAKYNTEGKEFAKFVSELVVFLQKYSDKIFKEKYRECKVDEFTSHESRFAAALRKKQNGDNSIIPGMQR